MKNYGKELILDLHDCNPKKFNRIDIEKYFKVLCDDKIDMKRCDLHWWDFYGHKKYYDAAPPHLKGTSAVQFIETSDIIIHTLDDLKTFYINIFSCKDFDSEIARKFTEEAFEGKTVNGEKTLDGKGKKGITICRM